MYQIRVTYSSLMRDPSWARFPYVLEKYMKRANLSSVQLATKLEKQLLTAAVTAGLVRKWRSGDRDPQVQQLPDIARALSTETHIVDVADLAAEIGMLPRESMPKVQTDLAVRMIKLHAENRKLELRANRSIDRTGYADLILAVSDSTRWAVAIEPSYAGPPDARVHVANRLVLRRIDGIDARKADLPKRIAGALARLGAEESTAPGWPMGIGAGRFTASKGVLRFSVEVVSRPHPSNGLPIPGLHSVLVLSTTVRSYPFHIAAHLADALGFGLTGSRDTASLVLGKPIAETTPADWAPYVEHLIEFPPADFVYHHAESSGVRAPETVRILRRFLETPSLIVWIRESDDLIRFAARHRVEEGREVEAILGMRFRDEMDVLLGRRLGPTIVQEVGLPHGVHIHTDLDEFRESGTVQALDSAALIVRNMVTRGVIEEVSLRQSKKTPVMVRARQLGLGRGERIRARVEAAGALAFDDHSRIGG